MKKRSRRVLILLMSALMICGAFGVTAFADDHTHQWKVAGNENYVGFYCESSGCEYSGKTNITRIYMDANDAYSGVPYDSENIKFTFSGKVEDFEDLPDGMTLSKPVYYKGTEKLDKAPETDGTYIAKVNLLINGNPTDAWMSNDFTIKKFELDAVDAIPGGDVVPFILIDGVKVDKLDKDENCSFEYLSLDSTTSEYTSKKPVNVGHYRVKATVSNNDATLGEATDEFEIRKLKANKVGYDVLYINDPKALLELDPEVVKFDTYGDLVAVVLNLMHKGYVSSTGTYGDAVIIVPHAENVVYSPKIYGAMTVTYKKLLINWPYVPGVTKLDAGSQDLTVTIKESRNNEKISKKVSVSFAKAEPKWTVKPTAKEGLVFNDRYQELVNPGKSADGTVYYGLVDSNGKVNWSKSIPTAKDATDTTGEDQPYEVKFRIIPKNENNYKNGKVETLEVSIASKGEDPEEPSDLAPGKVTLVAVTKTAKKSAVVRFRRVNDADSYEYAVTDKTGKTIKGTVDQDITKYLKTKVSGLNKNTKYKVKVRAVRTVDNKTYHGEWSKAVSFKTKR